MNIPYLCGGCHREGAPVAKAYKISEHNIIENYSQSIHGEGLFKKGLTVTATCTDCHGSHGILPRTESESSISPRNIAATCMKCHSRIEQVHMKVIRGELWEQAPGKIPACTDCHMPHKVRKEVVALTVSDRDCLKCHEKPDIKHADPASPDTLSLVVKKEDLDASVHQNITCVKCHFDVDPRLARPCETAGRVDCSSCHAKVSEDYFASGHGTAFMEGTPQAPYCTTCHGDHKVKSIKDEDARTYRAAVPQLCGNCHRANGRAGEAADLAETNALSDYSHSVHGRGLTEKGLLPSAICTDCHTAHFVLKHSDPRSSVSHKNIPATCATCHRGIYNSFVESVHFTAKNVDPEKLPSCTECHSAHTISDVKQDEFMAEVTGQCGSCHTELAETYLDTMHGKAYRLGYLKAAKCSDCHGAHDDLRRQRSALLGVHDQHRGDLQPVPRGRQRAVHRVPDPRHPPRSREVPGPLLHLLGHDPAPVRGVRLLRAPHPALAAALLHAPCGSTSGSRPPRRARYFVKRFSTVPAHHPHLRDRELPVPGPDRDDAQVLIHGLGGVPGQPAGWGEGGGGDPSHRGGDDLRLLRLPHHQPHPPQAAAAYELQGADLRPQFPDVQPQGRQGLLGDPEVVLQPGAAARSTAAGPTGRSSTTWPCSGGWR